jgi:nucleoside-diphosphate-sugar epimerase
LYSSSGSTVLQYKAVGFNSNDTGAANSLKTGRVLFGQYGEVMIESSTKFNANTLTTATFDVIGGTRSSGITGTYDPHSFSGINARFAVGASGAYDPATYQADKVAGAYHAAELNLNTITSGARFNNGTLISRPGQIYLFTENTWNTTYNITRGQARTLKEAAQIAINLAQGGSMRINEADANFPSRGALNISRAHLDFGYEPCVDIEQGFRTYYEWIDNSVYWSQKTV